MKKLLIIFTVFLAACNTVKLPSTQPESIGEYDVNRSGWAEIKVNKKLGFVDRDGKIVVKPIYDYIGDFDANHARWAEVRIGKKVGFIDSDGNEIVKPIYDYIGKYDEKRSRWAEIRIGKKVGFIDDKGKLVEIK